MSNSSTGFVTTIPSIVESKFPLFHVDSNNIPVFNNTSTDDHLANKTKKLLGDIGDKIIHACSRNLAYHNMIVTSDHRLYSPNFTKEFDVLNSDPFKRNNSGDLFNISVYQVAAGYNHIILLVDRLKQQLKSVTSDCIPSHKHIHRLPNGDSSIVPERSSLLCIFSSPFDITEELIIGGKHAIDISSGLLIEQKNQVIGSHMFWLTSLEETLIDGEYLVFLSCSAFSCVFITNMGTLSCSIF